MGKRAHSRHLKEEPGIHHRKQAISNNNAAAAQYLQAVVRGYLLRKSDNRDLLRARLDAYSKWTPATLFRAYCKFAQQTTTARAFKGAKLETSVFCAETRSRRLHWHLSVFIAK